MDFRRCRGVYVFLVELLPPCTDNGSWCDLARLGTAGSSRISGEQLDEHRVLFVLEHYSTSRAKLVHVGELLHLVSRTTTVEIQALPNVQTMRCEIRSSLSGKNRWRRQELLLKANKSTFLSSQHSSSASSLLINRLVDSVRYSVAMPFSFERKFPIS